MSERIRTSIETRFRCGTLEGQGEIKNVGEGGLFVGTWTVPDEGDEVELSVETPGGLALEISGMVWWTRRDTAPGFGLRILDEGEGLHLLLDGF